MIPCLRLPILFENMCMIDMMYMIDVFTKSSRLNNQSLKKILS